MGEPAAEDLRRKVGAALAAEWAVSDDPGVGHRADRGGDVFAATFTANRVVADMRLR